MVKIARNFSTMLENQPLMQLKLLQKVIQKTPEGTGDLIGNKIPSKITKS